MARSMPAPSNRIIWLFGLPSAGKTTLARALATELRADKTPVVVLDGDEVRAGVNADLTFTDADRAENLRRAAHTAKLLVGQGFIVIAAFVTPKEHHRALVRRILADQGLCLIHVSCPLDVCKKRDVKGLYAKAAKNEMRGMTGLQDPFEDPAIFDLELKTNSMSVANCIQVLRQSLSQGVTEEVKLQAQGLTRILPSAAKSSKIATFAPAPMPKARPLPAPTSKTKPPAAESENQDDLSEEDDNESEDGTSAGDTSRIRRKRRRRMKPDERAFLLVATSIIGFMALVSLFMLKRDGSLRRHLAVEEPDTKPELGPMNRIEEPPAAAPKKSPTLPAKASSAPAPTLTAPTTASVTASKILGKPGTEPAAVNATAPKPPSVEQTNAASANSRADEEAGFKLLKTDAQDSSLRVLAESLMNPYFKTTSWSDKVAFVHDPERVGPLMKQFYEKEQKKDPECKSLQACVLQSLKGEELLHLKYSGSGRAENVEVALRQAKDGSYKLDWESFVGASGMSWEDFIAKRTISPVLFRAYVNKEDYYNFEFSDEQKYLCVKLTSRDGKSNLYAYVERGTAVAYKVQSALARRPKNAALSVKLAFLEQAQSKDSIRLLDVVAERWFLLPSESR
jgi:adenylylsulfate kinase